MCIKSKVKVSKCAYGLLKMAARSPRTMYAYMVIRRALLQSSFAFPLLHIYSLQTVKHN